MVTCSQIHSLVVSPILQGARRLIGYEITLRDAAERLRNVLVQDRYSSLLASAESFADGYDDRVLDYLGEMILRNLREIDNGFHVDNGARDLKQFGLRLRKRPAPYVNVIELHNLIELLYEKPSPLYRIW